MSGDRLTERLAEPGTLIVDGGLATQLEAAGFDLADPLWSASVLLSTPEAVEAVHRAYVEAGADIITTATYQATYEGLAARGHDQTTTTDLLRHAVDLARRAAASSSRQIIIAASVGPYGAYLADGSEYCGDYDLSVEQLATFHRRRIEVLHQEADVLALETIPCLDEARALVRVLSDLPNARAWVSFSCRDDGHSSHGETIESCVDVLADVPEVVAVGVNCFPPRYGATLMARIRERTDKPIVIYPNAGERYADGGWAGHATAPATFADLACEWVKAGARIVGGCCRTGPRHTRELAQRLRPRST